jgi:hypothetical protein
MISGALGFLASLVSSVACAGAISLVGQLDPNNPQDAFQYQFTLLGPATVSIQTWGYGGTVNAPGGKNAQGGSIAPGGFDPYLSVFNGSGPTATFLASNDDGVCPPGTVSALECFDSTLTLPALGPGTYTVVLSTFENMSFAENYGNGTLADGFIGLGSFGGRTNNFAVDINGATVLVPTLALGFVPNALTFGPQTVNVNSGPLDVVVTNTGSSPVVLGSLVLAGANASDFTAGGTCTGTLAVGSTCVISVTFLPTVAGLRAATLSLSSNASGSPAVINLHGSGTSGAVASAAITTTDLDFGDQPLHQRTARTLVVTNVGGAPLVISSVSETGTNLAEFVLADSCTGQTIAAGETCALNVVFTPQATGPRSATVTINSNASNNPLTVTLRGNGVALVIPTLNAWGMALLSLLLATGAAFARRRITRQL